MGGGNRNFGNDILGIYNLRFKCHEQKELGNPDSNSDNRNGGPLLVNIAAKYVVAGGSDGSAVGLYWRNVLETNSQYRSADFRKRSDGGVGVGDNRSVNKKVGGGGLWAVCVDYFDFYFV